MDPQEQEALNFFAEYIRQETAARESGSESGSRPPSPPSITNLDRAKQAVAAVMDDDLMTTSSTWSLPFSAISQLSNWMFLRNHVLTSTTWLQTKWILGRMLLFKVGVISLKGL